MEWILWLIIVFHYNPYDEIDFEYIDTFKTRKECMQRFYPSLYVSYSVEDNRGGDEYVLECKKK